MPLVAIDEETKALMDQYKEVIKGDYITFKLFLDSAVRTQLRSMKAGKVGSDLIIAHLHRLSTSRQSHLDRLAVKRAATRHKRRITLAENKLKEL